MAMNIGSSDSSDERGTMSEINTTPLVDVMLVFFWGPYKVPDMHRLVTEVEREAVKVPQPEIHIRADSNTEYKNVGKVIAAINRGGVVKVGFITEPDHGVRGTR